MAAACASPASPAASIATSNPPVIPRTRPFRRVDFPFLPQLNRSPTKHTNDELRLQRQNQRPPAPLAGVPGRTYLSQQAAPRNRNRAQSLYARANHRTVQAQGSLRRLVESVSPLLRKVRRPYESTIRAATRNHGPQH